MTAIAERQELAALATEAGWQRSERATNDYYMRRNDRVRVIWGGRPTMSGAALYQDDIMITYSNDVNSVRGWLKR